MERLAAKNPRVLRDQQGQDVGNSEFVLISKV